MFSSSNESNFISSFPEASIFIFFFRYSKIRFIACCSNRIFGPKCTIFHSYFYISSNEDAKFFCNKIYCAFERFKPLNLQSLIFVRDKLEFASPNFSSIGLFQSKDFKMQFELIGKSNLTKVSTTSRQKISFQD